jgi:hypothetical protein
MPAFEVVTAQGTAIGATIAALTASAGDSFAIKSFDLSKKAYLLAAWADVQVAGTARVRSPKFHDNVNGIRYRTTIGDMKTFMPYGAKETLYPNDNLTVELAGSAVAGDLEYVSMLHYYEDLPGISARLLTRDQVLGRIDHLITVENTIATPTTGGYGGSQAINTTIDQFQTGADYAILGYKCNAAAAVIGWKCPEFGNLRVAGPGDASDFDLYCDHFMRLSLLTGLALVPVFNGQNKASVLIDAVQDENGADPIVTTFLAKLKSS